MTERLPHEKGFHVSWDQLHRDARALAWRLDGQGPDEGGAWRAVVAITRGGMAPAMIIARELDIRLVDTISVKSYNQQTQSEPRIIKMPDQDLVGDGEGVFHHRAFITGIHRKVSQRQTCDEKNNRLHTRRTLQEVTRTR